MKFITSDEILANIKKNFLEYRMKVQKYEYITASAARIILIIRNYVLYSAVEFVLRVV